MEPDLIKADVCIAEHRARVARAERFGWHLSIRAASPAPRHTSTVAVAPVAAVPWAVGAALSRGAAMRELRGTIGGTLVRLGERLRGSPHPAATGGIGRSANR